MKDYSLPIMALLVVGLVLGYLAWNREKGKATEYARVLEVDRAKANGLLEAERRTSSSLGKVAAELASKDSELQDQLDRARKVVPSVKVERVVVLRSTGAAGGEPLPPAPAGTLACPPCLLQPGDPLTVELKSVELRSALGNLTVLGTVDVSRGGAHPTTLMHGPVSASASQVMDSGAPSLPRVPTLAVRAGPRWTAAQLRPTGAFLGLDRRLLGHLWLSGTVDLDVQSTYTQATVARAQYRSRQLTATLPAGSTVNLAADLGLRWEW